MIEPEVRLGPQTRTVSSLLEIESDLTIARPELNDVSQDIEEAQVWFSGAGSGGTSRESGTLSIKLGSAQWEKVVAHFPRLPGIYVLLGFYSELLGKTTSFLCKSLTGRYPDLYQDTRGSFRSLGQGID